MASALETVDAEEVDAEFDGGLSVADCRALVQDDAAVGLEELNHGAGRVAGCFNDIDALVDANLRVFAVGRCVHGREEGNIHAEWVLRQFFRLADFLAEVFGCRLREGCELGVVLLT